MEIETTEYPFDGSCFTFKNKLQKARNKKENDLRWCSGKEHRFILQW